MADEFKVSPEWVSAARAEGYTDREIVDYLGKSGGLSEWVSSAKKEGYSPAEIVDYLAPPKPAPAAPAPAPEKPASGVVGGVFKTLGQQILKAPGGAVEMAGSTAEVASLIDKVNTRKQLDVFDRVDAGETFKDTGQRGNFQNRQDLIWANQYRGADPETRAAMRQHAESIMAAGPDGLQRTGADIRHTGESMLKWAEKTVPLTPEEESRSSVQVTKLLTAMVPYVAAAVTTGGAGLVGYGTVESLNRTYTEAVNSGADPERAAVGAVENGLMQGVMNVIPAAQAARLLERLPAAARGKFVEGLAEAAMGAGNMITMAQLGQIAENAVAAKTFEPDRKWDKGVGENLGVQAAAGAILPLGAMAVGAAARRVMGDRSPRVASTEETGRKIMDAPSVEDAITLARDEIDNTVGQLRELGTDVDRKQADTLELFSRGDLAKGEIQRDSTGNFFWVNDDRVVSLKPWDGTPGEGKISPDLAQAQSDIYGKMGFDVIYIDDANTPFDGAVLPDKPNTIFLSTKTDRNAAMVGAHEVGHLLESVVLPDGTNLGSQFIEAVARNVNAEGLSHAMATFDGREGAPRRDDFGAGREGDAAYARERTRFLIQELAADTHGEMLAFSTFMPKVIDQVQARYGADTAKGVLAQFLAGLRDTMQRMREMFFGGREAFEYGSRETVSQRWFTNIEEIHDIGARIYAEKFGTQAEKENAALRQMRERVLRERALQAFEQPAAEAPPPAAPEGFTDGQPRALPDNTVITPEPLALGIPDPQRPSGPPLPAAYAEAAQKAAMYRRWLGELDEKRRADAPESPEAKALQAQIETILGKVRGNEDRLTNAARDRLEAARTALDEILNPVGDSPDMARVRAALQVEQQRMADAAAVGTPSPGMERAGSTNYGRRAARPRGPVGIRGEAVMPQPEAAAPAPEVTGRPAVPAEPAPAVEATQLQREQEAIRAMMNRGQEVAPPPAVEPPPALPMETPVVETPAVEPAPRNPSLDRFQRLLEEQGGVRWEPPAEWQPTPDELSQARRLSRGWTPEPELRRPQSLVDFVRKNGGLSRETPEGGDLRAADLDRLPGVLRRNGQQADFMAQAAADAGYRFGQETRYGSGVDVDAFIQALSEDAGGRRKHYPETIETEQWRQQQAAAAEFHNYLEDIGLQPKGMEPRRIAWILQREPEAAKTLALAERADRLMEGGSLELMRRLDDEAARADLDMAPEPGAYELGDHRDLPSRTLGELERFYAATEKGELQRVGGEDRASEPVAREGGPATEDATADRLVASARPEAAGYATEVPGAGSRGDTALVGDRLEPLYSPRQDDGRTPAQRARDIQTGPDGRSKLFDDDVARWRDNFRTFLTKEGGPDAIVLRENFVLRAIDGRRGAVTLAPRAAQGIAEKHRDIPASVWGRLPELLADPQAVYPHRDGGLNFVVNATTAKGEPIVVGVRDGAVHTITPFNDTADSTGSARLAQNVLSNVERGNKVYVETAAFLSRLTALREEQWTDPKRRSPVSQTPDEQSGDRLPRNVLTRDDVIKGQGRIFYSPRQTDTRQPGFDFGQSQRAEDDLPLFGAARARPAETPAVEAPATPAEPPVRPAPPPAPAGTLFDTPAQTRAERPATPAREPSTTMLQDAGEKIGGARKDLWAERGLRLSDLEGMSEGEAYKHVTKDGVWPKPDYAAMVEGGMTPEAAAMVKIIRDRLAARPKDDSPEGRRNYVTMMNHIREAYAGVKTADDFRAAREKVIYDMVGWPRDRGYMPEKSVRDTLFSVFKGRSEDLGIDYADRRRAAKLVAEGFPGKVEPWTRRFEIRERNDGTFALTSKMSGGYRRVISDGFRSREEAEAAAKVAYTEALSRGDEAPLPTRPHLDTIERTGADIRGGRNVTGDDFVKDFGFRGVEFGNWVASDERQRVVNYAYDGLHDMANVLGIPVKALSLDGQIGLAFGARGSGRAAAHYEPDRLVINMTKLSGAGSLAHEWAHALDHYFGVLDTPAGVKGEPKGASGWYEATNSRLKALSNLRPEMAEAFDNLMTAIFKRDKTRAEAVRDAELRVEEYQGQIERQKQRMEEAKARPHSGTEKFLKQSQQWIEQRTMMLAAAGKRLAELRDETVPYNPTKVQSSFYEEAQKLSGKSGTSGYWARPTEMFARAFESYVFDKIKEQGGKSQYLVQGVEADRNREGYRGNPYPDMDRPAINAAFDKVFEVMDVREGKKGPALFSPRQVPVDTEKLAPRGTPFPEVRLRAIESYGKLRGTEVENEATGRAIQFDATGERKTIRAGEDLLRLVPSLPEMLRKAVPIGAPEPDRSGRSDIKAWHRFGVTVDDGDALMNVVLTVRELRNGSFHYSLNKDRNQLTGGREGLPAPEDHGGAVGSSALEGPAASSVNIDLGPPIRKGGGGPGEPQFSPRQDEARQPAPVFYSAVERAVQGAKMEKAAPGQWLGTLKNMPGVKPEEIQWLGLEDWLKGQPKSVTKQEVLDYVRANQIEVKEVHRGERIDPDRVVPDARAQEEYAGAWDAITAKIRELSDEQMAERRAGNMVNDENIGRKLEQLWLEREDMHQKMVEETIERMPGRPEKEAKWGEYVLPGGQNYRELLLTLPVKVDPERARLEAAVAEAQREKADAFRAYKDATEEHGKRSSITKAAQERWFDATAAEANAQQALSQSGTKAAQPYRSSHWDEPNVLAHIRFDDRTGSNGERVLHVAEIQSDWHQEGRKRGYREAKENELAQLVAERDELSTDKRYAADSAREAEIQSKIDTLQQRIDQLGGGSPGVPDAPFKTTWPELAMKRVIRYAAENGYDRVSWDTGATNAERYDLSKQVSSIDYERNANGTYDLAAQKDGSRMVIGSDIAEAKLADYVGKEVADKIAAGVGDERKHPSGEPYMRLSGLDLKVGGEGMIGFYDKQLPIIANKLGKKFGAKVEPTNISGEPENYGPLRVASDGKRYWLASDTNGKVSDYFDTAIAAMDAREAMKNGPAAHSLPITDAMRKAVVEEGQPLFSPRIRAAGTDGYTDAQRAAAERVRGVEGRSLVDRIAEIRQDLGRKIVREVVDPYIGVKERDAAGYLALRNANSVTGAVDIFNTYGPLRFEGSTYATAGRTGGPVGLIRDLGADAVRFMDWVAANRAEKLKAEDRENLYTAEDIRTLKTLNQGQLATDYKLANGKTTRSREAAYLDALQRLDQINKNARDIAVEAGLVKRGVVDALWSDPYYVPFYRQAEADNSRRFVGSTPGMTSQTAGKKLLGGSEKLNENLWQNAFGNWAHLIDASIRNRAANQVLMQAAADGIVSRITAADYDHKMTKAEKADVVWTMVNGDKQYWRVDDPMTLKAVAALDYVKTAGPFMDVARGAKKLLQTGVAASYMFQLRSLMRDTTNSIAVSPLSFNVFKNLADGAKQIDLANALSNVGRAIINAPIEQGRISQETADAIAGGATMRYASGVDQSFTGADAYLNTPDKIAKFRQYFARIGKASTDFMGAGENLNRLALYRQLGEQGVPHDVRAFAARDLSDFTLTGASPIIRTLVDVVPYMNAWMQGLYKVGRSAAESNASRARLATVLMATTVLGLALDAYYSDDPYYQNRDENDRNSNFAFKVGSKWFHLPMGFEVGALSRLATIWTETLYDTNMTAGRAWKNTLQIAGTQMAFNPTPQLVKPLIDVWANERRTGGPIETAGMERLRKEYRSNSETTLVSKGVSGVANAVWRSVMGQNSQGLVSPVQLDYLASAYAGWLGTTALQIADFAVRGMSDEPEKPAGNPLEYFTQGMIRDEAATRSTGFYINMLYKQGDAIREAYATFQDLAQRGRGEEAKEYLEANRDLITKYPIYSRTITLEGELNKQIRAVTESPMLSPEEKRERIRQINAMKTRAAENVFRAVNQ